MNNKAIAERSMVFQNSQKRRYGSRLEFQVLHAGVLGDTENVTFLLDSGAVATLAPARQASWEGGRQFELKLEGFPTAAIAEEQGRKLSQAILWTAISLNYGLRLSYRTQEPATVVDRTVPVGDRSFGEATTGWNPQIVAKEFVSGFGVSQVDPQTLLSMEIFCSSSLEGSDRAAFLTAVSALEPLAEAKSLGPTVDNFVDDCLALLATGHLDEKIRASLKGRVDQLRQESIGQALRRMITAKLPDDEAAPALVSTAYSLRSQLIHNGRLKDYDVDLAVETKKIRRLLRMLYAQSLQLPLFAAGE